MTRKRGKGRGRVIRPQKAPTVDAESSNVVPPVPELAKEVCRLCGTKEGGPFLNLKDENNILRKINELMPFGVAENDELPHKICFRCSAKVEELHEFIEKCIKTQENYLGKKCPTSKVKTHRSLWEEKLNCSNISNDDICDAVIKKAMEGIKDIPLKLDDTKSLESKVTEKSVIKTSQAHVSERLTSQLRDDVEKLEPDPIKKTSQVTVDADKNEDLPKKLKLCLNKCDNLSIKTRSSRLDNVYSIDSIQLKTPTKSKKITKSSKTISNKNTESSNSENIEITTTSNPVDITVDEAEVSQPDKITEAQSQQNSAKENSNIKPFDIMDHVSMIKVNGVGVLFQCKLCNRNFLKKVVVLSHWCARKGAAKEDCIKGTSLPEPPRLPTVKYINTKMEDTKKHQEQGVHSKENVDNKEPKSDETTKLVKNIPEHKPKPKIGPASKVKRINKDVVPVATVIPTESNSPQSKSSSVVKCAVVPSLNCRYKLVPGPNNTFTLVEALPTEQEEENTNGQRKRKLHVDEVDKTESISKQRQVPRSENCNDTTSTSDVIDLEDHSQKQSVSQPYPVGLFRTVNRHSKNEETPAPNIIPFAVTPQMKQSYTIVQTDNPNKLLISTKPQPQTEEAPKKKQKKSKPVVQEKPPEQQQPFSVTLEDTSHPKDSGFFTFINVDPLLQPSYVLPTDNTVIQESQISTSAVKSQAAQNPDDSAPYTCSMCNEKFSREQKLLAHLNCHYSKIDEEDQSTEKPRKRRTR